MRKIELSNVNLGFRMEDTNLSLRKCLMEFLLRKRPKEPSKKKYFQALDNISLTLEEGDKLGIVGRNGAGKTTLLRVIAGIYQPTQGFVSVQGKVTSLLSVTGGSHPELTGYETIRSQLVLQGFSNEQVKQLTPIIEEFSELGDFLKYPIRTYSSGMGIRLCFSIVTNVDPEILIMDEWLSAGDLGFVSKAERKMRELVDRSKIFVISSHDLSLLEQVCNKMVMLDKGKIVAFGSPTEVVEFYRKENQ